jgi:hypothetical protein
MVLMFGYELLPKRLTFTHHLVMFGVRSVTDYKTSQSGVHISHQIAWSKVLWNMICMIQYSFIWVDIWCNTEALITFNLQIIMQVFMALIFLNWNCNIFGQVLIQTEQYLGVCFLTCYRVMMSWFIFPSSMHWICSIKLEDMRLMNCKEYERWWPWYI